MNVVRKAKVEAAPDTVQSAEAEDCAGSDCLIRPATDTKPNHPAVGNTAVQGNQDGAKKIQLKADADGISKEEELFTIKEVAARFRKNSSTIWRWRRKGILKVVKIEGTVLIPASSVASLITRSTR